MVLDKQYFYKEIQDEKSVSITENKTVEVMPDGDKIAIRKVSITVNMPQVTLNSPTTSLSDDTLTITDSADNGNFTQQYSLYDDGVLFATIDKTSTVDLTEYLTDAGTHKVVVKACRNGMLDSESSAEVTYIVA